MGMIFLYAMKLKFWQNSTKYRKIFSYKFINGLIFKAKIINVERRLLPNLPTLIKKKVYRKATLIFYEYLNLNFYDIGFL